MNQWTLRTQIFCIQLTAAVIIIIILFINIIIQYQITNSCFDKNATFLVEKQLNRHTFEVLRIQQTILEGNLAKYERRLSAMNDLFNYMFDHNIIIAQSAEKCGYKFRDLFCYGIQGNSSANLDNRQQLNNLTQLYNEFKYMLLFEVVYLSSVEQDQYFILYPEFPLTGYMPHSRPWYISHIQNMRTTNYPISDPYLLKEVASVYVQVTMTSNLTLHDNLRGVIGLDLNIRELASSINQFEAITISLINNNGQILLSKYYNSDSSNILYIDNYTLTGIPFYNSTITDIYKTNSSNCPQNIKQTYCIYNEKDQVQQILRVVPVKNFYYLMQIDYSIYLMDIYKLYNNYQKQNMTYVIWIFLIGVSFLIISTAMFIITTLTISQPIARLSQILRCQNNVSFIQKEMMNLIRKYQNYSDEDQISRLQNIVQNVLSLNKVSRYANQQLLSQERIQYPLKCFYPRINIKQQPIPFYFEFPHVAQLLPKRNNNIFLNQNN